MKYEIKSIRVWSFLKIIFFLNIFVGFVGGFLMAFFAAMTLAVMKEMPIAMPYGVDLPAEFPIGALFIIYPIMGAISCAVFLTVFEVLVIALYNLFAKLTGGIELNLTSIAEVVPVDQPVVNQATYQPPPPVVPAAPPPPSTEPSSPPPPVEPPTEPYRPGQFEPPQPPPPDQQQGGDLDHTKQNPDDFKPE